MTTVYPRLRVLVVENEDPVKRVTEELLQELGHEVVGWARTADDAVRQAEMQRPSVVLMDIQLDGDRDGIDAASEIADRFGIASLFVIEGVDPLRRARAHAISSFGFVRKHFVLHELDRALRITECAVRKEEAGGARLAPAVGVDHGATASVILRSEASASLAAPAADAAPNSKPPLGWRTPLAGSPVPEVDLPKASRP